MDGNPSLPEFMRRCMLGHLSQPTWTQSTLPTQPGSPRVEYSPTTRLNCLSYIGIKMNSFCIEDILAIHAKKKQRWTSSLKFVCTPTWCWGAPVPKTLSPPRIFYSRLETSFPAASIFSGIQSFHHLSLHIPTNPTKRSKGTWNNLRNFFASLSCGLMMYFSQSVGI